MTNPYRGYCSPFERTDISDRYQDGVLTVFGCFSRHKTTREEQLQDNFKHQPLVDAYRDMYDTFKFFERHYQFKEKFKE
jgi:hypothetical protein